MPKSSSRHASRESVMECQTLPTGSARGLASPDGGNGRSFAAAGMSIKLTMGNGNF